MLYVQAYYMYASTSVLATRNFVKFYKLFCISMCINDICMSFVCIQHIHIQICVKTIYEPI